MRKRVLQATQYIRKKTKIKPEIGVILSTGINRLTRAINISQTLPYTDIPNFPTSTVEFHS